MQRSHTLPIVLTLGAACGSGTTGPKAAPTEPSETHVVMQTTPPKAPDAGLPEPPPEPKLTCDPGLTATPAPAPDPTWYCERTDGVRSGPFVTLFPDGTTKISGTYRDDKLDGHWERHHPSGQLAEEGSYTKGLEDGHWRQLGPTGAVLGEYDLKLGTGTKKRWYDDGPLAMTRQQKSGVPSGDLKLFEHDGALVVTAKYWLGKLDGPHVVGAKNTLRIEETFKLGVRQGPRQIWQFWTLLFDEAYDKKGKLDGAFTIWRDKKIPRVQGVYDHGKRIGTWSWFDRNNKKEREGDYADGKKSGAWFEWADDKMTFSGSYTDGKPDGEFVYYDTKGNELGRFTIKDGTGTMLTFFPNHKPATKTHMYQGLMDGVYQELTPRGKILVEGRYSADRKHGAWKEQTELGVPISEEHFKRGKLDGVMKKFIDGKVAVQATYKDGKVEGPYTEYRDGKPSLAGQFTQDRKTGTWTWYGDGGSVVLTATYKDGVLDGPYKQLADGAVIEGAMVAGRRGGTWTRTEKSGAATQVTYGVAP